MAADSSEQLLLLNHLADEFAARYRLGERPSLEEYIQRHPELADDIREFFPTLVQMEQIKDDRRELPEPATGPLPTLEYLNPAIPRDLVTIVQKTNDRDPGRRYATAGELADDLQRFLADEPIKAAHVIEDISYRSLDRKLWTR